MTLIKSYRRETGKLEQESLAISGRDTRNDPHFDSTVSWHVRPGQAPSSTAQRQLSVAVLDDGVLATRDGRLDEQRCRGRAGVDLARSLDGRRRSGDSAAVQRRRRWQTLVVDGGEVQQGDVDLLTRRRLHRPRTASTCRRVRRHQTGHVSTSGLWRHRHTKLAMSPTVLGCTVYYCEYTHVNIVIN